MQKLSNLDRKYEDFRWFFTSNNVLVVGGKSDEQNEIALENFSKPNYIVMHTTAPGSPFMIIQSDRPTKKDLEETAVFCACFSQQWKLGKRLIEIDVFAGEQIYKLKGMKTGTFGLNGTKKTLKVRPELVLVIQNGKLKAVPKTTNQEKLAEIRQGSLSKLEAAEKISKIVRNKYAFPISKEEILQAIPSDKLSVR
ncbi:MAG: NFACT RNA binding domain-containing protein [Candidatus Pacearchaeota archaeon]|jgi:predicted ribosome quality control (RQC) complex YloA/Tae2 family protein